MKKKPARKTPKRAATPSAKKGEGYGELVSAISQINTQMVTRVATAANQALVMRNWIVGAYIVEYEQKGADRAEYGARLLETLAGDLKAQGVKSLSVSILERCRQLFQIYPQVGQGIPSTVSTELAAPFRIPCTPSTDFALDTGSQAIRQTVSAELPTALPAEDVLRLSWSQLQELIRLDDPWKRAFYENECLHGHWSVRQLQRQIGSQLYERTGLSTNKKAVIERARTQKPQGSIVEVLRDPYILEFTGLAERPEYTEDDLESALLDHVQRFLLELGRGFCFEARQFRMTEGRKHHRVDLVFYHRLLRCHVLLDLKIRPFEPANAGQMSFYVNWFKANMMAEGDNPPIGILLCSDKDGAEVEFAPRGWIRSCSCRDTSRLCPAQISSKPCWSETVPKSGLLPREKTDSSWIHPRSANEPGATPVF